MTFYKIPKHRMYIFGEVYGIMLAYGDNEDDQITVSSIYKSTQRILFIINDGHKTNMVLADQISSYSHDNELVNMMIKAIMNMEQPMSCNEDIGMQRSSK